MLNYRVMIMIGGLNYSEERMIITNILVLGILCLGGLLFCVFEIFLKKDFKKK